MLCFSMLSGQNLCVFCGWQVTSLRRELEEHVHGEAVSEQRVQQVRQLHIEQCRELEANIARVSNKMYAGSSLASIDHCEELTIGLILFSK